MNCNIKNLISVIKETHSKKSQLDDNEKQYYSGCIFSLKSISQSENGSASIIKNKSINILCTIIEDHFQKWGEILKIILYLLENSPNIINKKDKEKIKSIFSNLSQFFKNCKTNEIYYLIELFEFSLIFLKQEIFEDGFIEGFLMNILDTLFSMSKSISVEREPVFNLSMKIILHVGVSVALKNNEPYYFVLLHLANVEIYMALESQLKDKERIITLINCCSFMELAVSYCNNNWEEEVKFDKWESTTCGKIKNVLFELIYNIISYYLRFTPSQLEELDSHHLILIRLIASYISVQDFAFDEEVFKILPILLDLCKKFDSKTPRDNPVIETDNKSRQLICNECSILYKLQCTFSESKNIIDNKGIENSKEELIKEDEQIGIQLDSINLEDVYINGGQNNEKLLIVSEKENNDNNKEISVESKINEKIKHDGVTVTNMVDDKTLRVNSEVKNIKKIKNVSFDDKNIEKKDNYQETAKLDTIINTANVINKTEMSGGKNLFYNNRNEIKLIDLLLPGLQHLSHFEEARQIIQERNFYPYLLEFFALKFDMQPINVDVLIKIGEIFYSLVDFPSEPCQDDLSKNLFAVILHDIINTDNLFWLESRSHMDLFSILVVITLICLRKNYYSIGSKECLNKLACSLTIFILSIEVNLLKVERRDFSKYIDVDLILNLNEEIKHCQNCCHQELKLLSKNRAIQLILNNIISSVL